MSVTASTTESIKRAPGASGVEETILGRWSPRAFADREVSGDDLKKLFEAARWAASSNNEQPWRFLVGRKGDETYRKIFDSLVGFNQAWAGSAPVLMLSVGKRTFVRNGNPNRHALHDTGAAMANLALQATAQGLHTHSMAGFDNEKIRQALAIPDDYELGAVTAIGYLGDADTLSEAMRVTETTPRERRPLDESTFSAWNKPLQF
jgi:nitroreductase